MTSARQFTVTGVLIALTLSGCAETDASLFTPLETMTGGGGTVELAGSADILEGQLLGDCSGVCGKSYFARTTTIVGDLDGDGRDDLVFSVPGHTRDLHRAAEGAVYVVYGRSTWADEETVVPDAILEMAGIHALNAISVARAGDVDGDGHADFLVGDRNSASCGGKSPVPEDWPDPSVGSAYLIYGGPTRLSGTVTVTDVASAFVDDEACRGLGASVASAGDLDGDGFDDFVIGNDPDFFGGNPKQLGQGRAHLFYGGADRRPAVSPISAADAVLRGRPDQAGFARGVTAAGDVDGDGDGDLLIAENDRSVAVDEPFSRASYLVRGGDRLAGEVDATSSSRVAIFSGEGLHGVQSAGLGDIDEDGRDDFALGGGAADYDTDVAAFIFYGRADGFDPSVPVSTADAILRRDPALTSQVSLPIAAAGDHDRDGHRDIIIGDPGLGETRGGLYFISGQGMRWTGDAPVADVATTYVGSEQPYIDEREAEAKGYPLFDYAGASLDGNGDVDGDGNADLVVGGATEGDALGRAYLVRSPASAASR